MTHEENTPREDEDIQDEEVMEQEELEEEETLEEEVDHVQQELERLRMQLEENQDLALRAQAELDNVRKRTTRDIENAHKYALEKFVAELLPVVDSLELGINASDTAENVDSLREGMDLTLKMFSECLQKYGVTIHNPTGEKFNPEFHEAVSMLEQEGMESGMVISVMQKGYDLNGRLIRPAMVVVAK